MHFVPGTEVPRPGDVVTAEITYAAPHHLVSDAVHGSYWTWAQRRKRAAFRKMAPRVR